MNDTTSGALITCPHEIALRLKQFQNSNPCPTAYIAPYSDFRNMLPCSVEDVSSSGHMLISPNSSAAADQLRKNANESIAFFSEMAGSRFHFHSKLSETFEDDNTRVVYSVVKKPKAFYSNDRRLSFRITPPTPISVKAHGLTFEGEAYNGNVIDLSLFGAAISTHAPTKAIQPGSRSYLSIHLYSPDLGEMSISAEAYTRSWRLVDPGNAVVGVEFTKLNPADETTLSRWLQIFAIDSQK